MRFGKDNKVEIDSLRGGEEAKAYCDFLKGYYSRGDGEIDRHRDAIGECIEKIKTVWEEHHSDEYRMAYTRLQVSGIERHLEDIRGAEALIEKVRGMYEK